MKQSLSTAFKDTTSETLVYFRAYQGGYTIKIMQYTRTLLLSAITIIIGKGSCAILRTWGKLEGGENLNDEEALNETKRL
ncbi:unnamed protein product [Rhizophagus irregularis]|nr:unnamed protein product [Rhizophagus irregularis]CAB4434057.1 unnamed protein product [Rhizophagus irregularis]